VQRPEPSEGACGEQKRWFSRLAGPAKVPSPHERPVEIRSGSDLTTIRSCRRKTPRSRSLRAPTLRGVARARMTFDPSASSIASRSDPRPRVSRCDRRSVEPGDERCPGVFEPGLRSPPPHRWRATPRLTGLSGRCACIRSGSLRRRSTSIALEPATIEGLFPSFEHGVSHPRDASAQRREKTGRPTARSIGREDKRSITAGSDLVS
jgi:hypothetical protein